LKTIILPGYSPYNKEWAYEIKDKITNSSVIEWDHWSGGSMSLPREITKIKKKVGKDTFNIIAKSLGTRVTMHLISELMSQINKIILCGIPTKLRTKKTRELYTRGFIQISSKNILVIQNKKDPFANAEIITKFVRSVKPKVKVIEKDRSDHNYPYPEDFVKFLTT